jgi:hypothetical protein
MVQANSRKRNPKRPATPAPAVQTPATPATPTPVNGCGLHGEVVSWGVGGASFHRDAVAKALTDNGLDASLVKNFLARHAFARACHQLREDRLIEIFREDRYTIEFQFTRRVKTDIELTYHAEAMLVLDKQTGHVSCPVPELELKARLAMDRARDYRMPADITRIVQRLFDSAQVDLFRIRRQGGAYFVPQQHVGFIDQVHRFLPAAPIRTGRWPAPSRKASRT